ncbi:MAG: RNA methyltransferase [Vicinamibacteria bacterium]|jgi:tRNA/rRNA methyltransferase|nr:RNA methyltransferase [Vicinamibacteria bacterium]
MSAPRSADAARVRVVLVRPETSANVGACARVIRNAGLDGLDLVRPGDWRTIECWRTAWKAQEVLEGAREFDALRDALAEYQRVYAFSRRTGATIDVRAAAEEIAQLSLASRIALVFGPETAGLTLDELALCGQHVTIPAHPDQPSLNLSHAVMVAAYEVYRAARSESPRPAPAAHEDKQRLLELGLAGLRAAGALPAEDSAAHRRDWQGLLMRLDLTPHEVRMLEHVAHRLNRMRRGDE